MSGRKNYLVTLGLVLSVSLIAVSVSIMLAARHYGRVQFDLLNALCGEIVEREPETRKIISAVLKEYVGGKADGTAETDLLSELGYCISDFSGSVYGQSGLWQWVRQSVPAARSIMKYLAGFAGDIFCRIGFAAAGFLVGVVLFLFTFLYRNKMEAGRILALADYLERVNTGQAAVLSASGEDDFSKLEDEIYKTVTYLYQTKEAAVQAKNDFAENLSNIAHQIKTPITAVSLSLQMLKTRGNSSGLPQDSHLQSRGTDFYTRHLEQIEKQLSRLTHLEEALLVLSRLDAGTLPLQKKETDVYTLLVLAADNLQELFAGSGAFADIPELGEMMIAADPDWTMEAVMNLMKNCMEHSRGKTVHCSYAQNPLYTEILIWDEGEGFAKEDIPHLFERFYRGQNAGEGGIGIGLALAKEIIERQNGTIRARNKRDGGACFEVRFYSH